MQEHKKRTYLDGLMRIDGRTRVSKGEHVQRALYLLELAEFDDRHGTDHFDTEVMRQCNMSMGAVVAWTVLRTVT
jgi:hypothetical protein